MKIPGMHYQCGAWKRISDTTSKIVTNSLLDLQQHARCKPLTAKELENNKPYYLARSQLHFCGVPEEEQFLAGLEEDELPEESDREAGKPATRHADSNWNPCPKARSYEKILNCHGENGYDLISRLLGALPSCQAPEGGAFFTRLGNKLRKTSGERGPVFAECRRVLSEVRDVVDAESFNHGIAGTWPYVREQLVALAKETVEEARNNAPETTASAWVEILANRIAPSTTADTAPFGAPTLSATWHSYAYHDGRSISALVSELLEVLQSSERLPIVSFRSAIQKIIAGKKAIPRDNGYLRNGLDAAFASVDPGWNPPQGAGAPRIEMSIHRIQGLRIVDTSINKVASLFQAQARFKNEIKAIFGEDLKPGDSATPLINAFLLFATLPSAPGAQCKASWLLNWSKHYWSMELSGNPDHDPDEEDSECEGKGPLHTKKALKLIEGASETHRVRLIDRMLDEFRAYSAACPAHRQHLSFDEVADWAITGLALDGDDKSDSPGIESANDAEEMRSRLASYDPEIAYYLIFEALKNERDQTEWILSMNLERKIEQRFAGKNQHELRLLEKRMFERGDLELPSFKTFCRDLGFETKK